RSKRDWSSDVCSSDLGQPLDPAHAGRFPGGQGRVVEEVHRGEAAGAEGGVDRREHRVTGAEHVQDAAVLERAGDRAACTVEGARSEERRGGEGGEATG